MAESDIIGNTLGFFGLAITLMSLSWALLCSQLPRRKLQALDLVLEETTGLLDSALRDGLIPSPRLASMMQDRLSK